ncbi:MAG: hypothetical protein ACIAXF_10035 [Phycisphaerales bacterium JB063]
MSNEIESRIARLERVGRRWRWAAMLLACVVMLGMGMAMQDGLGRDDGLGSRDLIEDSQGVSDPNGFAVFVRRDGNVVIVKHDGTIIRTSNQPMAVGF